MTRRVPRVTNAALRVHLAAPRSPSSYFGCRPAKVVTAPPTEERAPVAQRIEHLTTDQKVRGSNPSGALVETATEPALICGNASIGAGFVCQFFGLEEVRLTVYSTLSVDPVSGPFAGV